MLDKLPINWPLISTPINWVIVLLMVIIAGFVIDIFVHMTARSVVSEG